MAGIDVTQGKRSSDELSPSESPAQPSRSGGELRQRALRFRVACLVLACILPVCFIAGFVISYAYQQRRNLLEQSVLETARALSMVVDQELAAMQASATALATSPSAISGDVPAFDKQAHAVLRDYSDDSVFTLNDAGGQQIANTFFPLGTPLPKLVAWAQTKRVFETGKPVIVNLYSGALTKRLVAGVAVPVIRDGQVKYALMMTAPANHFEAVLSQQSIPANWPATILDGNRVVVARDRLEKGYVGLPAVPALIKATSEAAEGHLETTNRAGVPIVTVFSRSPKSGWTVGIGIPKAVMLAGLRHWLLWTVGGALLLLLAGISLALILARRISGSIRSLIVPAVALGSGEPVDIGPLDLAEANEVGQSLAKASQLLQQRTAERDRAEEHVAHVASFPELNPNPIFETDLDGKVSYANPAAQKMFPDLLEHGANHPLLAELASVIAEFTTDSEQVIVREVEAGDRVFLQTNYHLPELRRVRVYFTDITARKQAEEQLQRLNRTLRALSNSNQELMHATDEPAFLQQVCRIIHEDCGHAMVWIGFAENDENKTVRPVASAGFEEGYLETMRITWADGERGRGPTGTAIRTGRPSMCRNMLTDPKFLPWREEATKRGYACSLVVPLKEGDKTFGAITIYSRDPDTFSEAEVKLLTELADDLAYGLGTLRIRAAHAQAEEALRSSQAKLQSIIGSAMDAVISIDEQQRVVVFNRAAEAVFQCTASEAVGSNLDRFIPKSLREVHRERIRLFESEGITARSMSSPGILTAVRSNGEEFPIEATISQVQADGEKLYTVILRDITERKQAESILQTTLQRFYAILSSMYSAVLLVTDEGRVEFANQAFCDRFGLADVPADLVGLYSGDMLEKIKHGYTHPEESLARIREVLDRGQPVVGEELAMQGGGTCLRDFIPLNVDGKSYGRLWLHMDISERKRAEQALLRSEKLASVGRMAAAIAHEINNPLEAVTNALFIAKSAGNLPETACQYLDMADAELKRIAHITRQSLGFYRESNAPALMSVNAVLESAIDLLKSRIKAKQAVIEKQWDGDVQVIAVAGELRQVFSNLLSNSLDAIDVQGTIKLRVSTGAGLQEWRSPRPGNRS